MANYKCYICDIDVQQDFATEDAYHMRCENCGIYSISPAATSYFSMEPYRSNAYLVSGYIREMNELGFPVETLTPYNLESLYRNAKIPKTIMEKLDKLVAYLYRKTEQYGGDVEIDTHQPAIAYAKSSIEVSEFLTALARLEYIDSTPKGKGVYYSRLTLHGMQHAESIQTQTVGTQCFIAMWFDPKHRACFEDAARKAIQATGYEPLVISDKEHNDKICDNIIAEIRKSRFLVADFTGHRGGVYFEAGFAYGLGIPVIWTCKQDDLINLHFDIRQYNFIDWTDEANLYERLKARIEATIPITLTTQLI